MTNTWMWQPVGDEPQGLVLDPVSGKLLWYAGLGCTCGEDLHPVEQTVAEYLQRGVPGLVSEPPEDVKAEINQAITMGTH